MCLRSIVLVSTCRKHSATTYFNSTQRESFSALLRGFLTTWGELLTFKNPLIFRVIINILKNNGIHYEDYNGECHGEFEGHIKLFELDKNIRLNEIKNINVKLLKLFQ